MHDIQELTQSDRGYERVLSSMCTYPHPVAVRAHVNYIHTNLGDPNLFPDVAALERRAIGILGSFLGAAAAVGYISSGGTESNIQAVRASKLLSRAEEPNIVVPESAHQSFEKARDFAGVDVRYARLDEDYAVDVSSAEELVDENTVCLVGIAGSTALGVVDPIPALARIARDNQVFLHVDAAFGGLVLPFLEKKYPFDFHVAGVRSMTVDPHKMGMSTIPSGGLLFKNQTDFDALSTNTFYSVERSMTGTRGGASIAATLAVLEHLGFDGYRDLVCECVRLTKLCAARAAEFGVTPVVPPVMNIVALKLPNLQRVVLRLTARGWRVSVMGGALRLVIMPHVNEATILEFCDDLRQLVTQPRP
ncbi:MAG TPA: tyrosine decarboxylase MfnA [Candidatus Bathyarchaeia archaeon]|nr:tyrosine decarboxylase MfnA [Candidatus Bathyarchaeia archaeon]